MNRTPESASFSANRPDPFWRPGGWQLTRRMLDFCWLPPGSRLLDVGCGPGFSLELVQAGYPVRATGLDLSFATLVRLFDRQPAFNLVQGDAADLPFADCSFSALLCECVLSHLDRYTTVLSEFERVLEPGGFLCLTDLYRRRLDAGGDIPGLLTQAALNEALIHHGFQPVCWEDRTADLKQYIFDLVFNSAGERTCWPALAGYFENGTLHPRWRQAGAGYYLSVARRC